MGCPRLRKTRKKCCYALGSPCCPLRTLGDIARCYIRCCRPAALDEMRDFRWPVALSDAVRMAGLARDAAEKKFTHQWRIQNRTLEKSASRLGKRQAEIRASGTFEKLYLTVHQAISEIK